MRVQLLAISDYDERIRLYFDDEVKTLEIPSPWLRHRPRGIPHPALARTVAYRGRSSPMRRDTSGSSCTSTTASLAANRAAPRLSRAD